MSTHIEALEKKLINWETSVNGFIVLLRSRNTFDDREFALGIQMLKEYLKLGKGCVSQRVLQIILEIQYQLCVALQFSVKTNNLARTETILHASHQLRELANE